MRAPGRSPSSSCFRWPRWIREGGRAGQVETVIGLCYPPSKESDTALLDKTESEIGYEVLVGGHIRGWGPSMSFRGVVLRVLVLGLVPVVSTCVSSGGAASGAAGTSGSSTLIVRAQLEELANQSAYDAVETLNRRWILPRRGVGLATAPAYARVVVDGVVRGELVELDRLNTANIETMRYLSAPDATIRYGTGFPGGAIEVTTRRR